MMERNGVWPMTRCLLHKDSINYIPNNVLSIGYETWYTMWKVCSCITNFTKTYLLVFLYSMIVLLLLQDHNLEISYFCLNLCNFFEINVTILLQLMLSIMFFTENVNILKWTLSIYSQKNFSLKKKKIVNWKMSRSMWIIMLQWIS